MTAAVIPNDKALEIKAEGEHFRALEVLRKRTKQDVKNQVSIIYGSGNNALSATEQAAVAAVTWNMGLDISPGAGHLWAWRDGKGFHVQIGYRGWLFKAEQYYRFVYSTRVMTDEERAMHGVKDGQIGAVCELYDVERAKMWKEIGLAPKPIIGTAIVDKSHTPPNGRTVLWVAEKRATVDALRHLGLAFGPANIPNLSEEVPGMVYDAEGDEYVMPVPQTQGEVIEGQVSPAQESQEAAQVIQDEDRVAGENAAVTAQDAPNSSETVSGDENHVPETNKEKMSRPLPFPALREMIQKKAQNGDGMDIQMTNGQRKAMFAFMGNLFGIAEVTDEQIQAQFIRDLFEVETRSALTEKQFNAVKAWAVDEKAAAAEIRLYVEWIQAQGGVA